MHEQRQAEADALVIFGITGDLAKKMTLRSLYRLERRGLLGCPIVGVAVEDWTVERLREHAREAIEGAEETLDDEVFERFAARLSYVGGDFTSDEPYKRLAPGPGHGEAPAFYLGDAPPPVAATARPACSIWRRRPRCSPRSSRACTRRACSRAREWSWRSPSGTTWPRRAHCRPNCTST